MGTLAVAVLVALAGCGGDGDACPTCNDDEVCFRGSCTSYCSGADSCGPGHACVALAADSGALVCDPRCDDTLCPERMACQGRSCALVECAARVPCTEQGTFCDLTIPRCRPISGVCAMDADCPTYFADVPTACVAGFCRVANERKRILGSPDETIEILSPEYGAVVGSEDELVFAWVPPGDTAIIVLVLQGLPTWWAGIASKAVWGADLTRQVAALSPSVTWEEGNAITMGRWQAGAPVPFGDGPLYLVIEAFQDGRLIAASEPHLFKVGSPWVQPGDPCDAAMRDSCQAPVVPMTCVRGACAAFCASAGDCAPLGLTCGAPQGSNPRVCE